MQSNLRTYTHDWTARDIVAHLVGWFTEFLSAGGVALPAGPAVTDAVACSFTCSRKMSGRL